MMAIRGADRSTSAGYAAAVPTSGSDRRPLVIAHRGASAHQPENTLAAFRTAGELGADWVELDVRTSCDGVLVVHHDPHLPDGRVIFETRSDELPAQVPTLAEALACTAEMGLATNVEIKALPGEADETSASRLADATVDLLLDHLERSAAAGTAASVRAELLITCFDPRTLARVRDRAPATLPTGFLTLGGEHAVMVGIARDGGHVAINPWSPVVDAELIELAHAAGLAVNVWTVDDPARLAELTVLGVDGLITNVVDVARAVVDGTG